MADDFLWTTCGNADVLPQKRIGRSGYGDVFEILSEIESSLTGIQMHFKGSGGGFMPIFGVDNEGICTQNCTPNRTSG
jgi:hypothetical protein